MIVTRYHLRCDGDGCSNVYQCGDVTLTGSQVRRAAQRAGWRRVGGQDVCGSCAALRAAA